MMRFDRFTEQAQEAARRADEVMQRYNHTQVDVEHFFLAMLELPEGLVVEMLERMGAPIATMKERLTDNLQRTPPAPGRASSLPPGSRSGLHHPAAEARRRSGDGRSAGAEG